MKKVCFFLLILINILTLGFARDYWGSIAINTNTGIVGAAYDYDTNSEAKSNAIFQCANKNKKKKGCILGITFANSCGAVAWTNVGKFSFGAMHDNEAQAKIKALNGCKENGGVNCKIVESLCTNWETIVWW